MVDADLVAAKPSSIDHIHAAALPLAGTTALAVIEDRLEVGTGDRILINGAAGGVGLYAVQLARARGAIVAASAGAPRRQLLEELGAAAFVDYQQGDVAQRAHDALGALDCVADLVGGSFLVTALPFIREGGRAASIVDLEGNFEEAIDRNLLLHGVLARPSRAATQRLAELVDAGALAPVSTPSIRLPTRPRHTSGWTPAMVAARWSSMSGPVVRRRPCELVPTPCSTQSIPEPESASVMLMPPSTRRTWPVT
ncbi:MAG: zinc-binding dehydrogenase [Actinobacteria bacterium]|nr:zinc-binding dehydrogenase [Actinomycetota bacterium]